MRSYHYFTLIHIPPVSGLYRACTLQHTRAGCNDCYLLVEIKNVRMLRASAHVLHARCILCFPLLLTLPYSLFLAASLVTLDILISFHGVPGFIGTGNRLAKLAI
ncbi:hypothetical protein V1524DRAFT_442905 [Lipomyces starkeyi]